MLDSPTGRLEKLSNKPMVKATNHAQSTLDPLRGALYALSLAALDGYEHRPKGKSPTSSRCSTGRRYS